MSVYLFSDLIESGSKTIITKAADHGQELNDEKTNMSGILFTVFLTNTKYTMKP